MCEQVSYFADWSDRDFFIWLAAFIEGEGCIYCSKAEHVEITIANTNRDVIESIRLRLGFGTVTEVQHDRAAWKTKYTWRTRRQRDVRHLLVRLLPHLTFKQGKALEALSALARHAARETERVEMIDRVTELRAAGRTHAEIAAEVGTSRSLVSLILAGKYGADADRPETAHAAHTSHQAKDRVTVRTRSRIL